MLHLPRDVRINAFLVAGAVCLAVFVPFLPSEGVRAQGSLFALRFHGTGTEQRDRVRIRIDDDAPGPDASAPADVGRGSFTIEFWVRGSRAENSSSPGTEGSFGDLRWIDGNIIVDRDLWGGSDADFGISIAGGRIRFGTGRGRDGSDENNTIEGSINVLDDAWHHVAVVRDAASGRKSIRIDGVEDYTSPPGVSDADLSYPDEGAPGQVTPWGPFLVLGAEKHDAGPEYPSFSGYFDELRLWNIARSPAEIAADRGRVVVGGSPGLVAAYRFEEGLGTAVRDSSGAGSPEGLLIAGVPGNGEWVSHAVAPSNTAPIVDDSIPEEVRWRRCDSDCSGTMDMADVVTSLDRLFTGGAEACCPPASDCNSDGEEDVSDAVFLLQYLFGGGGEPAWPFSVCGLLQGQPCGADPSCPAK